jgi:hypothetical protein
MKHLANSPHRVMQAELSKLDTVRSRISVEGYNGETAQLLSIRVRELKRLAEANGYPQVAAVAESMRRMIDDPHACLLDPLPLLDAHIASFRAA